ncbi:MAG: hypothetical protein PHP54_00250 [Clostridia bacterium]|nr:hypothetical protein [Clostridia bacterium]
MNNQNDANNNMLNSKVMELLSTIDKSKLEQVTRLVQNMSTEDVNNLVGMLNMNKKK